MSCYALDYYFMTILRYIIKGADGLIVAHLIAKQRYISSHLPVLIEFKSVLENRVWTRRKNGTLPYVVDPL